MINYLSSFTNTDGNSFPDTKGINASGAGATDGTEFVKIFIDDLWGARQAIMDHAGLTPDTVTEAPGTSQFLEAVNKFTIPGMILPVFWNDDPATLGIRAILLTGQGVLRASFPELDAIVYVGDSDNPTAAAFFRADNADGSSRNTTGIYLILPDARGRVIRGLDLTGGIDPDGASRELGDEQADAMQTIRGAIDGASGTSLFWNDGLGSGVFTNKAGTLLKSNAATGASISSGVDFDNSNSISPSTAKTDDVETRMVNLAANQMITY